MHGGEQSRARCLLDGVAGRDGFVYHDGYNQTVHQAAPGLLGLLESRYVIERWNPPIVRWLDDTQHFFNHLCAEFEDEPAFQPIRQELDQILRLHAPLPIKNRFLFQYLNAATRELERSALRDAEPLPASRSLNGRWQVRHRRSPGHYLDAEMDLPLNWELVPGIDNYAGTMRFTRAVTIDAALRHSHVFLCFSGVDYFSDLWVNGHHVGGNEGYFAPFELDITPFLRFDQPEILRLVVTSPNDPPGPGTHVASGWDDFSPASSFPNRKTLVKGTLGHHDAKRGGAWSSLTSQDGNTGGVWNDIQLRVLEAVHFVKGGARITTLTFEPETQGASLHLAFTVRNTTERLVEGRLRVRVEPSNFEGDSHEFERHVLLQPGANDVTVVEDVAPVRPWEPRDHGFPHLYNVTSTIEIAALATDVSTVETGFRTLAVSPIGESEGTGGAFVVNGREVFVRGTNLLPTYWLSEYGPERIGRDFEMLIEAGFNAVLVHNLVLPKRFYERANREGFLVVQMFPLQWSYEQSAAFFARACRQIQAMAALLINEPCVVSYEVHNEPDMRTFEDLDNRVMDFDLHAALREADASRWATTFSGGNHAYPGQFYPLRDDNTFATLPARFLEQDYNGRRISRHRNMPTEFGIQAMPHAALFRELLSERRVRRVLERVRTDPRWLASSAETWEEAEKVIEETKASLGDGSWERAVEVLDWPGMWDMGRLVHRVHELEDADGTPSELAWLKASLLVLEVLHYGGFKGENFWFGLWRPAATPEEFVRSSQDRQYRIHKDAIEHYLNARADGPITGYFSFMFRDADWEAPTWGVVDAAWVPKKAYRAYLESNQPVRVTLPTALRSPVKLPGDSWFGRQVAVANDTSVPRRAARVSVWLEDPAGAALPGRAELTVDLAANAAWTGTFDGPLWTAADDIEPGTWFLRAQIASGEGEVLSTNSYEFLVPDWRFPWLEGLAARVVAQLLDGRAATEGFHYWEHGQLRHRAGPGMRGLIRGFHEARRLGIDTNEVVQGEHLFRHVLAELERLPQGRCLREDIDRIRSEIISPAEKSRVLAQYLERFVAAAEQQAVGGERENSALAGSAAAAAMTDVEPDPPVGRDRAERGEVEE